MPKTSDSNKFFYGKKYFPTDRTKKNLRMLYETMILLCPALHPQPSTAFEPTSAHA